MSGQCISYNNGGLLYELGTQNGAHLFLDENCLISIAYGSEKVFLLPGWLSHCVAHCTCTFLQY